MSKVDDPNLSEKIVDTSIELAEQRGWEAIHLYHIAQALNIPLAELQKYFQTKEDIESAWFDRADKAILQAGADPELHSLALAHRLQILIMAWLDALASHRKVTRQMIMQKMQLGHLHENIQAFLHTRRTVLWLLETAHGNSTHLRRAIEEIGLTGIFTATIFQWLNDDSANSEKTRRFLQKYLYQGKDMLKAFNKWIYYPCKNFVESFKTHRH